MLKKLSEKIGFTQTEIKVTTLLLVIFAVGFSYKTFFRDKGLASYKKFDYSKEDSTFLSSGSEKDTAGENKEAILELTNNNANKFPIKVIAAEKSIDLNTAGLDALITLPGVGKKTAERIIELRTKLGRFKNFNELLEVKNIGNKRLDKIKKYAYIK